MHARRAIGMLCGLLMCASHVRAQSLTLHWTDMSDNEDGFRCERQADGGSFAQVCDVGPNVQSWQDTTVALNVTYCYRVLAWNSVGSSPYSNTACGTPTAATPDVLLQLSCTQTPEAADPSLLLALALNETSGLTATDTSGANHHGTLSGATWTTSGKYGGALAFDGSTSSVSLGNWNITGSALTIMAWVRSSDWKSAEDVRIISKATGTQEQEHWWMLSESGNTPRFRLKAGGSTATLLGTSPLPLDTWVHIAATYDGAFMRLYQDGVLVGSVAKTGSIDQGTAAINMGRNPVGGQYISGAIDEVKVYNRALSQNEIQTEMLSE